VGTSTTAFVGTTRKGPYRIDEDTQETPELLTSYGDFLRIYGSYADLELSGTASSTNYLATPCSHSSTKAVRVFTFRGRERGRYRCPRGGDAGHARGGERVLRRALPRLSGQCDSRPEIIVVREIVSPGSLVTMGTARSAPCFEPERTRRRRIT